MKAQEILEGINIGAVEQYQNLALVRLFGEDRFYEEVLTLDEAIQKEEFEVNDSGSVPNILIRNGLDCLVFIPGGAIFEGEETQNRAAQYPSIIPAHSKVIPFSVNCAEQGQPLTRGSGFSGSSSIVIASARSGVISQDRTWGTITGTSAAYDRKSRTGDYASIVREVDLSDYTAALGEPQKNQVGYLAAIRSNGNVFFYADMFGNQELYQKLSTRLHESIAAVAKQINKGDIKIRQDSFVTFLSSAKETELKKAGDGEGTLGEVYLMEHPVEGSALLYERQPVQLALRKDVYQDSSAGQTIVVSAKNLK